MNNFYSNNDEIDLRDLLNSLIRRKIFLIIGLLGGISLSIFKVLITDKIYQGNFSIDTKAQTSSISSRLESDTPGISMLSERNEIENTIYVLQSPYVLKDVFRFYKEIASDKDPNLLSLDINEWISDSIFIENIPQTTVLKVKLRDRNQELISPLINKLVEAYQNYSIEGNTKILDTSISYIKKEIIMAEASANESLDEAQTFALNNSLMITEGLPSYSAVLNSNAKTIESKLLELKREANLLEQQIEDAKNADDVLYLTKLVPDTENPFFDAYTAIKSDLANKRITFLDADPSIQFLIKREKRIIKEINNYTVSQLESLLKNTEKRLEYLSKPNDVLQKHRVLIQKALNEQSFLQSLKDGLLALQLRRADLSTPWRVLSDPEVGQKPYKPKFLEELIIFVPIGILIGSLFGLIYDYRTKLIYKEEILTELIPYKLLDRLSISESSEWDESINLIVQGPLSNHLKGLIGLLPLGNIDKNVLEKFEEKLSKIIGEKGKLVSSKDLLSTKECSTQILLVQNGMNTQEKIKNFLKRLNLQNSDVSGWIFFKNKNDN